MNDPDLKFNKRWHSYHFKGEKMTSVTSWVAQYKQPFDKDKWSNYVAERDGKPVADVLAEWDAKRDRSCDVGHHVHTHIENCLNDARDLDHFPMRPESNEYAGYISAFYGWLAKYGTHLRRPTLEPERMVCWPDAKLAGTIDLACELNSVFDSNKSLFGLIDWKTNEKITQTNAYERMKPPFEDLPDCNWSHYCLQLNLYRIILMKAYDLDVRFMRLIHLRPDATHEVYTVPL
jgi:ATP-dependent exoDNAse (exonuclease V) beta subunit (contains helicase and exonuclease domains)